MLKWAIIFALIAMVAGALGFGGVAAGAAGIAKVLFGLFLILAVDHLMDMGRSATNVIGNGLASAVVAKWEHARPIPVAQRPEVIV